MAQETLILKLETSASARKLNRFHKSMMAFDNKVKGLQGSLRKLETVSKRSWEKFGNHVRRARRRVQVATAKMKKAILSLKGVLTGLGIGLFVRQIFTAAASMERFEMQLKTLTGSGAKARQIMTELQEVNKKSPFELPELVKASAKLKAYGVETENLVDMTERLGKISAGTRSDIGGIALAYGQALAKGKLMGEELRQFMERGVPVREELERMTGLTGSSIDDPMRKGQITADLLTKAIVNLTNETGKFGKAFENTADSLDTKLSNLQDAFFRASAALGKAFEPIFKWILDSLTVIFDKFEKLFARIARGRAGLAADAQARFKAIENTQDKFGQAGNQWHNSKESKAFFQSELERLKGFNYEKMGLGSDKDMPKIPTLTNDTEKLAIATSKVAVKWESIRETIAGGLTNAIMGLIDGTKSLGESLAGIAKQMASMFLNNAISSLIGNISFGGGSAPTGGGVNKWIGGRRITNYAEGGMVTDPSLAVIGEASENEYVIPASKMAESMKRYSSGVRGQAVVPGTGSSYGGGSVGGATVNYSGPILNFNSEEFVPKSAIGAIINSAASRGAAAGESRTIASLKNSRSRRSTLGL